MRRTISLLLIVVVGMSLCACSKAEAKEGALIKMLSSELTPAEAIKILGKNYDRYDESHVVYVDRTVNCVSISYDSFPLYGLNGELWVFFEAKSVTDKPEDCVLVGAQWMYGGNSEKILKAVESLKTDFDRAFGDHKYGTVEDGDDSKWPVWKNDRQIELFLLDPIKPESRNAEHSALFDGYPDADRVLFIGYGVF